jgi:tripartite-type tricarboxylate transporter receptor subunit TctC
MIDLRAGRITLLATSLASAAALMKDGKIRPLATTGAKRVRMLPDTPTVAESGLPGYEMSSWHGMLAPAKVPSEIITRLNHEIVRVLKLPDVQEKLLSEGGDITPTTPQEFAAFLKSEVAKWSKLLRQAGVTLD